jgi:hypothetical protein
MTKKHQAQYGDSDVHKNQGKAIWNPDHTVRESEHEHIMPKKNLQQQTKDPNTGEHAYGEKPYSNSQTLTIPRDAAIKKTHHGTKNFMADNQLRDAYDEAEKSGKEIPEEIKFQSRIEGRIGATWESLQETIAERKAAGLPTTHHEGITHDAVVKTAHYQQGETSQEGNKKLGLVPKNQAIDVEIEKKKIVHGEKPAHDYQAEYEKKPLTKPLQGANEQDINRALAPLDEQIQNERSSRAGRHQQTLPETPEDRPVNPNAQSIVEQGNRIPSTPNPEQQPGLALSQSQYNTPPAQPPLPSTFQSQQPGMALSNHPQGQPPSVTPATQITAAQTPSAAPLGVMKIK